MADQVIQRSRLCGLTAQPRALDVALDQAAPLQHPAEAFGDARDQGTHVGGVRRRYQLDTGGASGDASLSRWPEIVRYTTRSTGWGFIETTPNLDLDYRFRNFGMDWTVRYIGSAEMSPFLVGQGLRAVGSHTYHNFSLSCEA